MMRNSYLYRLFSVIVANKLCIVKEHVVVD